MLTAVGDSAPPTHDHVDSGAKGSAPTAAPAQQIVSSAVHSSQTPAEESDVTENLDLSNEGGSKTSPPSLATRGLQEADDSLGLFASATTAGATAPHLCGYLAKQGAKGLIKSFKQRWFECDDANNRLYYFEREGDEGARPALDLALGFIDLAAATGVSNIKSTGKAKYVFGVDLPERTYVLRAATLTDAERWRSGLCARLATSRSAPPVVVEARAAVDQGSLSGPSAEPRPDDLLASAPDTAVADAAGVAAGEEEAPRLHKVRSLIGDISVDLLDATFSEMSEDDDGGSQSGGAASSLPIDTSYLDDYLESSNPNTGGSEPNTTGGSDPNTSGGSDASAGFGVGGGPTQLAASADDRLESAETMLPASQGGDGAAAGSTFAAITEVEPALDKAPAVSESVASAVNDTPDLRMGAAVDPAVVADPIDFYSDYDEYTMVADDESLATEAVEELQSSPLGAAPAAEASDRSGADEYSSDDDSEGGIFIDWSGESGDAADGQGNRASDNQDSDVPARPWGITETVPDAAGVEDEPSPSDELLLATSPPAQRELLPVTGFGSINNPRPSPAREFGHLGNGGVGAGDKPLGGGDSDDEFASDTTPLLGSAGPASQALVADRGGAEDGAEDTDGGCCASCTIL